MFPFCGCNAAPARREATRLSDRTLVLVVNRLIAPGSEHGLARAGLLNLAIHYGAGGGEFRAEPKMVDGVRDLAARRALFQISNPQLSAAGLTSK
jgi:hypothetical protein